MGPCARVAAAAFETQAILVLTDDVAILAFRGTESKVADLSTDLRTTKVSTPLGNVHAGFAEAFANVWESSQRVDAFTTAGRLPGQGDSRDPPPATRGREADAALHHGTRRIAMRALLAGSRSRRSTRSARRAWAMQH